VRKVKGRRKRDMMEKRVGTIKFPQKKTNINTPKN
jgi:hypothetical protein